MKILLLFLLLFPMTTHSDWLDVPPIRHTTEYPVFPELTITHNVGGSNGFGGFYFDKEPRVNIDPEQVSSQQGYDTLFDHEVNHHVYFDYITDKERKNWERIFGKMKETDFVREYASQNANEAFADTLSFQENYRPIPDTKLGTLASLYTYSIGKKYKKDDVDTQKALDYRRKELLERVNIHFEEELTKIRQKKGVK